MANVLVFGAGGLVGGALCRRLVEEGHAVVARAHAECDITDRAAVLETMKRARATWVFNAAAFTHVDGAERAPDAAWRVNALGAEVVASGARACDARLVHYSTDFVFDGTLARPYDEFDAPTAEGVYARSKLAGEVLCQRAHRETFVVRIGCVFGRGGRNFPSTLRSRLLAREAITADGTRLVGPTWVEDVVTVSMALVRTDAFGLYHATSQGETTWAGFASLVAKELQIEGPTIRSVDPRDLELPAPRPHRAILDNRMLKMHGLDTMPHWQEAVKAYLAAER